MDSLKTIQNKLRSALRSRGDYAKEMETAITLAAGSYVAYMLTLGDVTSLEHSYVEEVSREGNVKLVPHPAFKTMAAQGESLRRALRELRLTIATLEGGTDDDNVEELIDNINNLNNEKKC